MLTVVYIFFYMAFARTSSSVLVLRFKLFSVYIETILDLVINAKAISLIFFETNTTVLTLYFILITCSTQTSKWVSLLVHLRTLKVDVDNFDGFISTMLEINGRSGLIKSVVAAENWFEPLVCVDFVFFSRCHLRGVTLWQNVGIVVLWRGHRGLTEIDIRFLPTDLVLWTSALRTTLFTEFVPHFF